MLRYHIHIHVFVATAAMSRSTRLFWACLSNKLIRYLGLGVQLYFCQTAQKVEQIEMATRYGRSGGQTCILAYRGDGGEVRQVSLGT
jgi:hypothetical protein